MRLPIARRFPHSRQNLLRDNEVYVNGELSDVVAGKTLSINYGVFGLNTVEVFAIDSNGNKSEAGTTTIVF